MSNEINKAALEKVRSYADLPIPPGDYCMYVNGEIIKGEVKRESDLDWWEAESESTVTDDQPLVCLITEARNKFAVADKAMTDRAIVNAMAGDD